MNRTVFLLAALLVGQAAADRTPENLRGLKAQDICTIAAVSLDVDRKEDVELSKLIDARLEEQNVASGQVFPSNFGDSCVASVFFEMSAFRSERGFYIYTVDYALSPQNIKVAELNNDGAVSKPNPSLTISYPTFWEINTYGLAADYAALRKDLLEIAAEQFAEFLADWRKTH